MIYIDKTPNPSGAYPNPKNQPFPGCIPLSDEQAEIFFQYNGFVTVTVEGETATVDPNTEAWEEWKASLPDSVEPPPTTEERVAALEAENKLLKEQVSAQADQAEFYEDCIAEMATVVYA